MIKRQFVLYTALIAVLGISAPTFAADPPIYGSQLMSPQERAEYRERIRKAETPEQAQQIRNEHHKRMRIIAKRQGVILPEEPPARGKGKGMGPGGMGKNGQGGGMGSGKGGGRN